MKPSPPPAAWLLNRFGPGLVSDSLAGDLMEEYARGRSRAWYWRQWLLAILIGFWTEVRTHKLLALRALTIGWAAVYLSGRFLYPMFFRLWWPHRHDFQLVFLLAQFAPMVFWTPALGTAGWIVGRLHRPRNVTMVLVFATSMEVWWLPQLPWLYRLLLDSLGNSRYLPYLAGLSVGLVLSPMSILLGGLLSLPRRDDSEVDGRRVAT